MPELHLREPAIPDPPPLRGWLRVRYSVRRLRGHLWFIRRFGLRRWRRYERARAAGLSINYMDVFTPDEFQQLVDECLIPRAK